MRYYLKQSGCCNGQTISPARFHLCIDNTAIQDVTDDAGAITRETIEQKKDTETSLEQIQSMVTQKTAAETS